VRRPTTTIFVTHDLEEAIFLGTRVVLMTPRPGRIIGEYDIDLPRPRSVQEKTSEAFVALRRMLISEMNRTKASTTVQNEERAKGDNSTQNRVSA
jgi:ABC-type nitrate/sulfonate/bicarbonate transport system ATPase subunit